jgi:hypothetical protein
MTRIFRSAALVFVLSTACSNSPSRGAVAYGAPADASLATDASHPGQGEGGAAGSDASVNVPGKDGSVATPGARDWSAYPPIVEIDTDQDIFALGDVHGDYDGAVSLLVGAKLVKNVPDAPEHATWIGGRTVLVITGDLVDKYTQNLAVLTLFQTLRDGAAAAGGRVVATIGNHEAEFLANPTASNTKAKDFVAELQAANISLADVGSGKHPVGQYLRSLPFAARVRDWFFCHAGNVKGETLAQLKLDLQSGVDAEGWGAPILSAADSLLEARLSAGTAPWWETAGPTPAQTLTSYATALNAKHIVMGHQPGSFSFSDGTSRAADQIATRFGTLFFIDVGLSRGVDGTGGPMLRITTSNGTTTASAIGKSGSATVVWSG